MGRFAVHATRLIVLPVVELLDVIVLVFEFELVVDELDDVELVDVVALAFCAVAEEFVA
jgi:uncharacterized protein YebE (UPF0316 family)